jgi:predicted AAA+ superfamily ATPase
MYLSREEEQDLLPMLNWKEATALIGPRRAGKTTLAKRLLQTWQAGGKPGAYFDLEALGAPQTADALVRQIEKTPKGGLVVLDEVQVLPDWVKVVRGQVDTGKRHIVATGSSAALLSAEIATALGGRAVPMPVLPLSFRDAKNWGLRSLRQYMEVGGYPECVLRPSEASALHKMYLELTVLRDVAARKGVREVKPLSDLALLILSEPGKTISAKKTASRLNISQPTFRSFISGFNDAFLTLSVPPFSRSPRERIIADAKQYAYDIGLARSVSVSQSDDEGRRLENLVAVELARRGYSLSYLKTNSCECDFIAQKLGERTLAMQVWGGEGNVPQRELDGLALGMRECKAEGLLLSKEPVLLPAPFKSMGIEEWLLKK